MHIARTVTTNTVNIALQRVRTVSATTIMKTIGTHDGKFHADEALACYMLRLLPEYADAMIVR